MKTLKVYCFPTHQSDVRTSGVDYARLLSPMKYLNGYCDGEVKFKVDFYDIHDKEKTDWKVVAKEHDLLYFNYSILDWPYVFMAMPFHAMFHKKIIMDLDDAIWYVQKDNISYDSIKKMRGPEILSDVINDVDGVTCTSSYLRNVIARETYKTHDKVKVMPNQVDLTLYNRKFPAKDRHTLTLLHYGSTSHFEDLVDPEFVKGIDKVFENYPNIQITLVGAFISELKKKWGKRYEHKFGHEDIYHWIKDKFPLYMDEADIIVVPLRDTIYNRCKSEIKWLEVSSAMKPGVFSETRPYNDNIRHGITGYLAKYADDWYKYLKILIDSKEKRLEIGTNAYKEVKKSRQQKDNIKEYASYFRQVVGI